ncbi:MAG TPA: hypothetical protein VHO24_21185 [Opitutaceae bacterium]|nr:hypothetical protein [Opitutaceae bacterium]
MKRMFPLLFAVLFFAEAARAIEAGNVERDVSAVLGTPMAVRKKPDGSQVWRFKDGTTVWLAEGLVQKITEPASGNLVRSAGSAEWVSFSAANGSAAAAPAASAPKISGIPAAEDMRRVRQLALAGGAALAAGVLQSGMSFFLDAGGWFLTWIFLPLVSLGWAVLTGGRFKARRAWRAAS